MSELIIPGLEVVEKKGRARGELLALCLSGSHAYGMNNEDSDFDLQGVYRAPTTQVLQLFGKPKDTLHEANVDGQPDFTIHELGKFVELASKANPTVLEVMYLEPIVSSPAWDTVLAYRDAFISTAIRRTYGGYAKEQLNKKRRREAEGMEGYSPKTRYRDKKHTRHIVRLFLQQRQILETGGIIPMLTAEEQVFLLEAQEWSSDEIEQWMNTETINLLNINHNIKPEPDYDRINELLLKLRGF